MLKLFFTAMVVFASASLAYADKVADMLLPSVEVITNGGGGSGTAVRVDDVMGTFIVTNYHVVNHSNKIAVKFYGDEKTHTAFIYSYDTDKDISVLVTPYKAKHVAIMGSPSDVNVFDEAYCVGNSHGRGLVPSKGIITAINYKARGHLITRTDCKIVMGNSGGGLFVQNKSHWVYAGMPQAVATEPVLTPIGYGRMNVAHLTMAVRLEDILEHLRFYRVIGTPHGPF